MNLAIRTPGTWNAAHLEFLAKQTDPLADKYIRILVDARGESVFRDLFGVNTNDEQSAIKAFPEIAEFFVETRELPPGTDPKRIHQGEEAFLDHMPGAAMVLLAKSLPEGYASLELSRILSISDLLRSQPYKRLLATLQMLINVSSSHAFIPGEGQAVITAQKLRLWHAAVRHAVPKYLPEYQKAGTVPVNLCDMIATIMGFSVVLIQGWRILHIHPSKKEEEDFYYLWRTFALMMGLHPPGKPHSFEWLPVDVADAEAFYAAYCKRYYVSADKNPEGVALAAANVGMLHDKVPKVLRWIGLGGLPKAYVQLLIGKAACDRVGITYTTGDKFLGFLLARTGDIARYSPIIAAFLHSHAMMLVFKMFIKNAYGEQAPIMIPDKIVDTWKKQTKYSYKKQAKFSYKKKKVKAVA
jgi:hypothetical protein